MKISAKEIILTASIGIVVHDGDAGDGAGHVARGRDRHAAAPSAPAPTASRSSIPPCAARTRASCRWKANLRKAIERQQIAMLYQPITRLASNQLAGFEALLRWDHPTRGRLGADDFIPIAEESGLIVELGSYVLGQALEEARRWHKAVAARPRSAVRQRQCVEPPAVPPGHGAGDQADAGARGGAQGHAQARDHRVAGDGESRTRGRDPHLAQDLRRKPRARRFRHRLLLVELSAPLPVRHHQGRPLAGPRQRAQRLDPADPPLGHRARARARQGGGGRGRRDAGRREPISARSAASTARAIIMASRWRPRTWPSLLAALASHRKRRERERARAPADAAAPKGLEVQVGGASPLPASARGTVPSTS